MCRNIRTLFNFDPPATDEEVRAASVQFVRKISGFTAPSKANEAAFNQAIDDIFVVARRLVRLVHTTSIGDAELRDQATRASMSVLLNLAEGGLTDAGIANG